MNKDSFWELIEAAKGHCGQDMDASIQWMKEHLMELGPQQAQDFHDIFCGYQDLAHQYGLWSAASIMCDGCTDDGFIDFRAWLIAQGREVYLAALKDPDSLADVEAYGGCQFERMAYAGNMALNALTGQSAYGRTDLAACDALEAELKIDIVYGEGIGYPYEPCELADYFPRLCVRFYTPDELESLASSTDTVWNYDRPEIQKARESGPPRRETTQINMKMEGM